MRARVVLSLLLGMLAAAAGTDAVTDAADAAGKAFAAGDLAALKSLAEKDDPDPWLVADELCARGQFDTAEAFAKAAPRKATEALPAYVAASRGRFPDAKAREALAAAEAALAEGKAEEALRVLGDGPGQQMDVLSVRLLGVRASALRSRRRLEESAHALLEGARGAERIGWLCSAAAMLHEAALSHCSRSDFRGALDAWEGRLRVFKALGDHVGAARTLANIGNVNWSLGSYTRALELLERALKLQEELGDRSGAVVTLGGIGNVHLSLGSYARALEYLERALEPMEDLGARAVTLGNIGNVYLKVGSYARALEYFERALKLEEELGHRAGVPPLLANIGLVHLKLGSYARALEYLERALKLVEDSGNRAVAARTLANIGAVHKSLGSHARALEYYERALKLQEDIGDRTNAALTLANIASVHRDLVRALEYYERALKLLEELGDRGSVARILNGIGTVHAKLGSYARAIKYHERALKLLEELRDRGGVASALCQMGTTHARLRSYARAIEYHERARALASEIGELEVEVESLYGLGLAHLALRDMREAAHRAREAIEKASLLDGRLSEDLGASAREKRNPLRYVGLGAALCLDDLGEACFFLESGRASGLLEALGGREALRAAAIPAEFAAEEQIARTGLATVRARLDRANQAGDRAEIRAAQEQVERARTRMLDITAAIQRAAKAKAEVAYPKAKSLAEIRKRLREDEALVLYALLPVEAVALVATRSNARLVRLGPPEPVEDLCTSFAAESPAALREAVAEPLALPASVKRILISPDGALSYVPFGLLVPDREIAYVPSGTTYDVLCDEQELRGKGVLALGDPDYGVAVDPYEAELFGSARLGPLPATREEAKAIGEVVLLGKDATPARLMAEVAKRPRWRAVHIACHGLVDPERPLLSSLALTGGDLATLDVFRSTIPADLVVLSACETAKGKVYRSEGVVGFVRAFMFAGAPRVIVSLWKVDDDATRALMEKFYERWKGGAGAARALKEAQEHVAAQEKWKHPKYWAAWQLWGLPE